MPTRGHHQQRLQLVSEALGGGLPTEGTNNVKRREQPKESKMKVRNRKLFMVLMWAAAVDGRKQWRRRRARKTPHIAERDARARWAEAALWLRQGALRYRPMNRCDADL